MNRTAFSNLLRSLLTTAGLVVSGYAFAGQEVLLSPPEKSGADDIQIVAGKDRTVFEYRANGVLTMIKIVPKHGPAYYLVPADGSPHYQSLDYSKNLFPSWIILEW